jgi:hypothetical protein
VVKTKQNIGSDQLVSERRGWQLKRLRRRRRRRRRRLLIINSSSSINSVHLPLPLLLRKSCCPSAA